MLQDEFDHEREKNVGILLAKQPVEINEHGQLIAVEGQCGQKPCVRTWRFDGRWMPAGRVQIGANFVEKVTQIRVGQIDFAAGHFSPID